ncbi:kinase-like protein [Gigaspora margarita]|uniref:Kinase-like protein n=1 Tax=Gigaspora margarita TaxID=4874 RepID=A0A8H3X321_GIGMA|nr:kinase-like protein [Gigaspora margarita]
MKPLPEYVAELERYFKSKTIECFEYSQFNIDKCIGSGGYAVVYLATFQEKVFALKCLRSTLSLSEKEIRSFKRELECLYKVNHQNIVKFHGIARDKSTNNFMLVLQYADNGNLREFLQQKYEGNVYKISWVELIQIAMDITHGLEHLHDYDIIHRDLHSKNILINNKSALITVFGISKSLNSTTESSTTVKGLMVYIEPRCLEGLLQSDKKIKYNKKSNIYSLGQCCHWNSGIPLED